VPVDKSSERKTNFRWRYPDPGSAVSAVIGFLRLYEHSGIFIAATTVTPDHKIHEHHASSSSIWLKGDFTANCALLRLSVSPVPATSPRLAG